MNPARAAKNKKERHFASLLIYFSLIYNGRVGSVVDNLIKKGVLKTPAIIEAFRKIRRVDFLPPESAMLADLDEALPIGFGQTISQPYTVAFMMEILAPQKEQKILDIGSGSGWTSAILAEIVGPDGRVFSIERIPELYEFGKNNADKYGFVKEGRLVFFCQDATRGLAAEAPYDRIIAAASGKEVPRAWREQLKTGGRLVAPVENSILLLTKIGEDKFETSEYPGFAFVPLISPRAISEKK